MIKINFISITAVDVVISVLLLKIFTISSKLIDEIYHTSSNRSDVSNFIEQNPDSRKCIMDLILLIDLIKVVS